MNRKFCLQRIGLFLLLRFLIVSGVADNQRKCVSNVCFNGGTCIVEDRGSNEPAVFECLCPDGFTGTLCEEQLQCTLKCENGGECRFDKQKPICDCKSGFGGEKCQNKATCQQNGCSEDEICLFDLTLHDFKCQTNKCKDNPCKNNSTCRAIPDDYVCECSSKLSGKNCEIDIDECEEEPCLNSGKCENLIGDFKCVCPSGFSGKICEQRSGFCVQKPCGTHGECEELGDSFRCKCEDGFYGKTCDRMKPTLSCEKPRILMETEDGVSKCVCPMGNEQCDNSVEECTVNGQECKNGGICKKDEDGSPFCKCPDSFGGDLCQHIIEMANEPSNKTVIESCSPNPCQNGGQCSNEDGFPKCSCLEGLFVGQFCDLKCHCPRDTVCREDVDKKGQVECLRNITSCDDCFNAEKCVYADRRLMCLCSPNFSGPVCAERENACSTMKCSGNQICKLRRTSFGDTPYCTCPEGTFGSHCQRKINPATFNSNSVAVIQAPTHSDSSKEQGFSLEFSFRTTVPKAHLVSAESILSELDFSLELSDGYLILQLGEHVISDLLELRLNDADWYTVVLNGSPDADLLFELHDAETGYVLAHKQLGHHAFNVFTIRFGRRRHGKFFTGCLREIRINKMPIDVFSKDRSVDVLQGCQFQPQCKTDSCGHGSCIELWNSFRCECRRPYLPPNCLHELQEATFGKDNLTSNLAFNIQPEVSNSLTSTTEFSFLLRTNKPDGQIFYIGQSGEDDTGTFISCGLQNGTLAVDSRLGGRHIQKARGRRRIDDNSQHLVEVKRKDNNFTLYLDGSKEGSLMITRPFAHPLIADKLVLGGNNPQLPSAENQTMDSLFKGTLQDVRINEVNLPLSESVPDFLKQNQSIGNQAARQNLLMGTVSDDLCALKPCVHGTCENLFNDYLCSCQKGFMGKNCDMIDYCSSSPCVSEIAQCVNTHGGYICKAPATFAPTSQTKFLLKKSKSGEEREELLKFSFAIRTRTTTAHVFKMHTLNESLSMNLEEENVVFHYANQTNTIDDPLSINLSNGQWHSIEIFDAGGGQLAVSFDNSTVPLLGPFSLNDFMDSSDSWLSFGRSQNLTGFKGCLHNVRFSNLPDLSFFSLADSGTRSLNGTKHFEARMLQNVRADGCHSKDLCGPINPCKNGALCRDLFNKRECECSPGFTGDLCEINVDECAENKDCGKNGQCIDGVNSFSCACKNGYSGPLCTVELNQCVKSPCKNDAKCESKEGKAVCECTDGFMGSKCQVKRSVKCKNKPCIANNTMSCTDTENGPHCECEIGYNGDLCEDSIAEELCSELPCKNGGKCIPSANTSIECNCEGNYEGQFCQKLKNNCKKGMCSGHGKCRSIFGGHVCECDEGWEGIECDQNRNECIDDFPCHNNGTCINKSPGYECTCPKFYLGKDCEIAGVCARSPCKNGNCIQKSATEYRCECIEGYTGKNCETEIDYCLEEPCANGATCQRIIGSFVCHCMAGFTGKNCETDIDDCAMNACEHGGNCIDRVNGFECSCENTGWQGLMCELDVNECEQPQINCVNGTCQNSPGSYECNCFQGFIGPACNMVDPCVVDPKNRTLHNCVHGNCINPRVVQQPSGRKVAEYECQCYDQYTGQFCTHVEQIRKPISIGYILGPGVALLIVSILLVCMLFFFVARNRRANQGTYSPSTHEMNGAARVQMHNLQAPIKKQERLI